MVYWIRVFCLEAAGWTSGLSGLFTDGDLLARGKRGGGAKQFTATSPLLPSVCMLGKTKSNQKPFLSAEKQAARSGLPAGRCDSLHSNYGSALFLCSTLGSAVQSQTGAKQREQGGHRQHRWHGADVLETIFFPLLFYLIYIARRFTVIIPD